MIIQLWRVRIKRKSGYSYKFYTGRQPRGAELAGEFERLYDPIEGVDSGDYSYQTKDGPQPDYYDLIMLYPK